MTLLTALALLFAAGAGVIRRDPAPATARVPVLTAFILCLAAELGDRTQFLHLRARRPLRQRPARRGAARRRASLRRLRPRGSARRQRLAAPIRAIRRCVAALLRALATVGASR